MNQLLFVEISIVKNDQLYRASLPAGVPWTEVKEALLEIVSQVDEHMEAVCVAQTKQAAESEQAEQEK